MNATLPPTDAERHRRTAGHVHQAVLALRRALKEHDGLEWCGVIYGHIADLEHVEARLGEYARHAEGGRR